MQTTLKLEAAAATHKGNVRSGNEDAYACCPEAGAFVVCDGMGGAAAGETASHLAVSTVVERICAASPGAEPRKTLESAIAAANRRVFSYAQKDFSLHGMGTTLVAAVICGHHVVISHVGDSRCYLFHLGRLIRLTNDHSLVDEQVRLGQLTPDQADRSPLRNVITRAIGTQKTVSAETGELDLETGDMLLLCTDGLTRELSDERIVELLQALEAKRAPVETISEALIAEANAAGGRDNVTCIVTRIAG
ncbi:Stp1/IreP family PP2C-type Ser/Thr phosphatase [Silvibacterium dinghuense]|uniref:Stp1/IreP family PP2C-type Ser/Thr phosphatase n=1 Tax=Silvibacterium dinghuense TaxID=1560006 RepID=A0A4Q1SEF7_9BACT|nr:Stp1/IreP family PP2C-type Ser/Thr phosphatase [Silvibacterium dinghuense]RXS95507.1 Stp1/IreP family PP2C-type Ser/Thr phosphatase [Silvibacterium dinghuense]GGH13654.1 protein-serine/threonine phosphatase [Silvibacterium dinghuense]